MMILRWVSLSLSVPLIVLSMAKMSQLEDGDLMTLDHLHPCQVMWNKLADIERQCSTWLWFPDEYNMSLISDHPHFFDLSSPYAPATCARSKDRRRVLQLKVSKNCKDRMVPNRVLRLAWQTPTDDEWRMADTYLAQQGHVAL